MYVEITTVCLARALYHYGVLRTMKVDVYEGYKLLVLKRPEPTR